MKVFLIILLILNFAVVMFDIYINLIKIDLYKHEIHDLEDELHSRIHIIDELKLTIQTKSNLIDNLNNKLARIIEKGVK